MPDDDLMDVRDPDLDVPSLDAYTLSPSVWMHAEHGVGYGVRVLLEAADGTRFTASLDTPEIAEQVADAFQEAARRAHAMRAAATPPEAPPEPSTRRLAARLSRWLTGPEGEHPGAVFPRKTCPGCGVVEGAVYVPQHHPQDCPSRQEQR